MTRLSAASTAPAAELPLFSYTAQVLAKSCKLIPVMVVGQLLHGKRYSSAEYLAALLIAGAVLEQRRNF